MWPGLPSALRFARGWTRTPTTVVESEVLIPLGAWNSRTSPGTGPRVGGAQGSHRESGPGETRANLLQPPGEGPFPGWVVLHGMSRRGRHHPELLRFVRALASTGTRVLVPEIPQWVALDFAPEAAERIVEESVRWLSDSPMTREGGVALMGFSFGAPQAVRMALKEGIGSRLRGVVGWGGYGQLEQVLQFCFTGEHSFGDLSYRTDPDAYARWVIGANCLPLAPAFQDRREIVWSLHRLASLCGERQIRATDPACFQLRGELRAMIPAGDRDLFDLFAPPSGERPDPIAASELVLALAPPVRRAAPLLDPLNALPAPDAVHPPAPIRLLHGRSDRMLPFTETLRLHQALADFSPDLSVRILGQFGHSSHSTSPGALLRVREGLDFLDALRNVLTLGD